MCFAAVLGWMESYRIKEEIRVAAAKMIQGLFVHLSLYAQKQ